MSVLKYPRGCNPYLTQRGGDREGGEDQYVANLCEGCTVAYKYFDLSGISRLSVRLRGRGSATVAVRTQERGEPVCRIPVQLFGEQTFTGELAGPLGNQEALYFSLEGAGHFDLLSFTLD